MMAKNNVKMRTFLERQKSPLFYFVRVISIIFTVLILYFSFSIYNESLLIAIFLIIIAGVLNKFIWSNLFFVSFFQPRLIFEIQSNFILVKDGDLDKIKVDALEISRVIIKMDDDFLKVKIIRIDGIEIDLNVYSNLLLTILSPIVALKKDSKRLDSLLKTNSSVLEKSEWIL